MMKKFWFGISLGFILGAAAVGVIWGDMVLNPKDSMDKLESELQGKIVVVVGYNEGNEWMGSPCPQQQMAKVANDPEWSSNQNWGWNDKVVRVYSDKQEAFALRKKLFDLLDLNERKENGTVGNDRQAQ
jgi:hypothetical protein